MRTCLYYMNIKNYLKFNYILRKILHFINILLLGIAQQPSNNELFFSCYERPYTNTLLYM